MKILNHYILFCTGCVLLLSFAGCGQKDEVYYSLRGKLSDLETPYIYVVTENNDSILLDTIRTDRNGNFSHKGLTDNLSAVSLFFDGKPEAATVFVNKAWNIEIEGNAGSSYLIYVTGGNENNDLTAFKKENTKLFESKARLLSDSLQNDSFNIRTINDELIKKIQQYVEKNTNKIAGVVLIRDFLKNNAANQVNTDTILTMFTGEAATFGLTMELNKYNERIKLTQTGAKAPEFVLKNEKKEVKSQDYKDKYVLISVSSTQKDSLSVSDFVLKTGDYQRLKDKNVEFLSVILCDPYNIDVPDSIKWTVFCEPEGWASPFIKAYNILDVPFNILISPTGIILGRETSPTPLIDKIETLIANKAAGEK